MIQVQEESLRNIKKVFPLLGEQIDWYWPQIVEGLKECPGFYDYFSPEWAYAGLKTGRLQVWALSDGAIRGIVITQFVEYPRQRVFEIIAIFGIDMLEFFSEMEDVFEQIARKNNCTMISAVCRPGLQRLLRNFKAETTKMVLRRAVSQKGEQ